MAVRQRSRESASAPAAAARRVLNPTGSCHALATESPRAWRVAVANATAARTAAGRTRCSVGPAPIAAWKHVGAGFHGRGL